MRSFPQLKVLEIFLDSTARTGRILSVIDMEKAEGHNNRNKLYPNNQCEAVMRFSKAHGFDNLVQIRGLQRVSLIVNWAWIDKEKCSVAVDAFEAFLKNTLTLPKDSSVSEAETTLLLISS
jgi:hypothetical protein